MKLRDYLRNKDRSEFAKRVGVSTGHINNLCSDSRYVPSRKLALRIEQETKGKVKLRELLFPNGMQAQN